MTSERRLVKLESTFPKIVCLCGSTKFYEEFQKVNAQETLAGNIVLSIATFATSEAEYFAGLSEQQGERVKKMLDDLHKRKIELADEVFIINKDGYVGESTKQELEYARTLGKVIRWLEPPTA
jgi:alkyl hydroperoxide reductase subunit AhpC